MTLHLQVLRDFQGINKDIKNDSFDYYQQWEVEIVQSNSERKHQHHQKMLVIKILNLLLMKT